jgi:hypothetical protein
VKVVAEEHKSHLRGVLDGDIGLPNNPNNAGQETTGDRTGDFHWSDPPTPSPTGPPPPGKIGVAAPGTGGGYHFDPETIAQRITDWEQVLDGIKADEVNLRAAWQSANPPSPDMPAAKNAGATRTSIQAAIDQNIEMQKYAQVWIDALQKANGTYIEHNQETSKGLQHVNSATDGHGLNPQGG